MEKFSSILQLLERFPDEASCIKYFEGLRWPEGKPQCPHCSHNEKVYYIRTRNKYKCSWCSKQFTVTVGTVFEDTHIPLRKWFIAFYLFSTHKRGVSSMQLAKDVDVTQKTAWFMLQRIRYVIRHRDFRAPLDGVIEVDETYVGGKEKNKHRDKRTPHQQGRGNTVKTNVFGMLQRGGKVITMVVPDVRGETLKSHIRMNVAYGSTIASDEWQAYNGLNNYYTHLKVDHGRYQYVDGEAHTNTLEGYWSHFKRMYHGTYVHFSKKHMHRYCGESDFRYNTRKETTFNRFNLALTLAPGARLMYKNLVR